MDKSSSVVSESTTGRVVTRRKMLGTEMALTNLSQAVFSLHPCNVGNKVAKRICGGGSTAYGHHLTGRLGDTAVRCRSANGVSRLTPAEGVVPGETAPGDKNSLGSAW
jgi:hypothetical protein